MADPRVPQGNLNRLRATVLWGTAPELNIIPSFLGQGGVSIGFDGEATGRIPTMTGVVNSPEPYQGITLTANLLKTQSLAQLYETRRQTNTIIGGGTVRTDVSQGGISNYELINMSISNVRELNLNGSDAGYVITLGGYMLINSALWGDG